jgi:hypothetical protein
MIRFLLALAWTVGASGTQITVLLPAGFNGWVCVDAGVAGAPPLPREAGAFVVRFSHPGQVVKTSETIPDSRVIWRWLSAVGGAAGVRDDAYPREQDSSGGVFCALFGTEDAAPSADAPPHIDAEDPQDVSPGERSALIALYEATDGAHWTNRDGWLGPPGTECGWHGVECRSLVFRGAAAEVHALSLESNNLTGSLPEALARLTRLESLSIYGNHLSGRLPGPLLRRWQAGELNVSAEMPLFSGVTEIDMEVSPSSLLCGRHRVIFRADGSAIQYTKRCRNATAEDRTTFCEVKEGRAWWWLPRLAWLIEKNGFYGLKRTYDPSMGVTEGTFVSTRVVRDGKRTEVVDYADAGPFDLWTIETAIEGVAAEAEWEKTTRQAECPRW